MRCPGARRAPTVSSCAWRHTRAENSGAKGSRRVIISTGRVIMRNLLLTGGASIILPFPPPANGQSLANGICIDAEGAVWVQTGDTRSHTGRADVPEGAVVRVR